MIGLCASLKVLMVILCFAAITSGAGERDNGLKPLHSFCALKADDGPCRAMIKRFFFNIHTQQCEEFVYGGCEGNQNRFESLEECKEKCVNGPSSLSRSVEKPEPPKEEEEWDYDGQWQTL